MRRRLWNSAGIRFFELDYKKVMRELEEYAKKAVAKGARAVILIGSLAKGDYTAFSDADVIIIVKRTPKQPAERIIDFLDPSLSIDLEPRIYTTDEFLKMASKGRRLVREAVEHGRLLAGDPGLIEMARVLIEKALASRGGGGSQGSTPGFPRP